MLPEDGEQEVQLILQPGPDAVSFEVVSPAHRDEWTVHVTGMLVPHAAPPPAATFEVEAVRDRCPEHLDGSTYYGRLEELGLEFGPSFRGVTDVWRRDGEALGRVVLPAGLADDQRYGSTRAARCLLPRARRPATSTRGHGGVLAHPLDELRLHARPGACSGTDVTLRPGFEDDAATFTGDARLYDERGELVAEALGLHLKRADRDALLRATRRVDEEWFYEVRWEACARKDGMAAPGPAEIAAALEPQLASLAAAHDVDTYRRFMTELDVLAAGYARRAFAELGVDGTLGEIEPGLLADRLGVAPHARRLFDRLVRVVPDDGDEGTGVGAAAQRLRSLNPPRGPRWTWSCAAARRCPACSGVPSNRSTCCSPVARLRTPSGSTATRPARSVLNALAAEAVAAAAGDRASGDRPVRLLEVGGGTGATTSAVLDALGGVPHEYWFTDVSPLFVARAAERFHDHPSVSARTLDVEDDGLAEQFGVDRFDVVIGANVLHATRDLAQSLERLRRLLGPSGLLVLIEAVEPSLAVDITFGLTDGWWQFSDTERRPEHPLLDVAGWLHVLADAGFAGATSVTGAIHGDAAGQAVFIAAGTGPGRRRWLVARRRCRRCARRPTGRTAPPSR